jgi:hypothetical protein
MEQIAIGVGDWGQIFILPLFLRAGSDVQKERPVRTSSKLGFSGDLMRVAE